MMVKYSAYPDVVMPTVPFAAFVLDRIKDYGDAIALVDNTRDETLTFSEIHAQTIKCANALLKLGIKKGDVIAIASSSRAEYIVLILAVATCGAAATLYNPLYQKEELLHLLTTSQPCAVFGEPENVDKFKALNLPYLKNIFCFGEKSGFTSYGEFIGKEDSQSLSCNVSFDIKKDLVLLPFSSGTTGFPKAVMLTHYSLTSFIAVFRFSLPIFPSNSFYAVAPMFHVLGFGLALYCLVMGVKHVFEPRFNLEKMFMSFEKYKITHFTAVPPVLLALKLSPLFEKYDTSSLKQVLCGAAPVAASLVEDIKKKYNIIVTQAYGLTECAPLSLSNPVTYSNTTTGAICSNTAIKIIDVETKKELGPDKDGEIVAIGPQMMIGYYKNPKATAETIDKDGWIHTGDIGHYDSDGMLYVVDRLKELVKCKGFQVAPAELEALLIKHPKIADAAVIGIPHPEAGEVPKGFVVKKDPALTEEDVKKYVADHVIKFKHLQGGVAFVAKIPKSASGKILRREIRKNEFGK